jgi:hypothetical protein
MMGPLIAIRDKFLREEGVMVPSRVSLQAALLTDESFHDECAFFLRNPYGIDFSSIAHQPLRQSRRVRVEAAQVDRTRFDFGPIDMKTVKEPPPVLTAQGRAYQAALTYGILAWFSCDLTDDVRFGTGPNDAPTHWDQLFFPFPEPYFVAPDREVTIEIVPPRQAEDQDPTWAWSISDGHETIMIDEAVTLAESELDPDID